ncbi:NASP-related protein sim3 [Dichotomopilus funicola]|uniref:NASP-related protein sim3 n=1 Tax=Dichotomopilus funicola TaxID=1934379 RepID=A0AAN6VAT6_9PEZI|nr:NASP-related protein sim3 [Dichotomopilus funicola]
MTTPTPATGTSTPLNLDPDETVKSLKVSLADLSAKATALYAHKEYEQASELYAQAAEMQAEMNGEMSPDNAEILFLYGRALFKVGQSKSDVLGGKAPEAKKPKAKPKPTKVAGAANGGASTAESSGAVAEAERKVDDAVGDVVAKGAAEKEEEEAPKTEQKMALFQFQGDENFADSDEEEEEEEEEDEGEDDEEDDDLAVAFEVLDLARLLFNKRLEVVQAEDGAQEGKGKEVAEAGSDSAATKHIKERLADTHDLLAEISLENERYPNAITDSRASLKYKEELYPFESEIIAEAHFKLSLALEFASVTKSSDDNAESNASGADQVDQTLRDEAASALEAAINSTKLKLQNKEVELATLHNPDDNTATRRQIADVKEVLADMEQRLVELRRPPVDLNAALGIAPAPQPEVSEEVKKNATDLSGLVRKKKRKAEEEEERREGETVKKAKEASGDTEMS